MTIVITVLKTLQNSFSLIILGSAQPKGQIPAVEFRKTSVGEWFFEEVVPVWEAQKPVSPLAAAVQYKEGFS